MGKVFNMAVEQGGIGVITFDVVGETMNTWTEDAFSGFDRVMQELEKAQGIRGIIFISGKPENFLAGANLKLLSQIESAQEVRRTLDLFHGSFNRLIALRFPSVAAIHGHCLGGGLEFALACTGRIAREGKTTLIGLPECNVGLFPGGGGTQRLPRLIGYPAFELILKGTMLPAAKALEMGIIDRLIPAGRRPPRGGPGVPRRDHRGEGGAQTARPGLLPDRRRRRDGQGGDPQGDQGPGDPGTDAGPQIDA